MKKFLTLFLALSFLLLIECSKKSEVKSIIGKTARAMSGLSIRNVANRDPYSKQIGTVPINIELKILDVDGYFYYIGFGEKYISPSKNHKKDKFMGYVLQGWVGRKCLDKNKDGSYTVNGKGASVLDKPNNAGKNIGILFPGWVVKKIKTDESWYKINYNNVIGWVYAKYLKVK